MNNLAIIPARGGSKRIPKKNIRDFLGKPIISYSITAAINSSLFSEVMVSTDDEEIATIARSYGAKVPFLRSRDTSDDFATTMDVIKEVLDAYRQVQNCSFNSVCCIYPTAPLIEPALLAKGYRLLIENNYSSVFPVMAFGYPIWRGLKFEDGRIYTLWPEYSKKRSQDLPAVYHDAGQWYWFNPLLIKDSLFTENSSAIVLAEEDVQDIDNESDWRMAEMKYINKNRGI